jgi:vacuolar-type H+-ATPase subunit I/STV1
MKNIINLSFVILTIAFIALGCSDSGETTATENNTNTTVTTTKTTIKTSTPSEANETLFSAIKNKDKETIKQISSKKSLEVMIAEGKKRNLTLDEVLDKQLFVNVTLPDKLEQRDEKINGNKATVEMFSDTGEWTKNNFVKEDGTWKVNFFNQ